MSVKQMDGYSYWMYRHRVCSQATEIVSIVAVTKAPRVLATSKDRVRYAGGGQKSYKEGDGCSEEDTGQKVVGLNPSAGKVFHSLNIYCFALLYS